MNSTLLNAHSFHPTLSLSLPSTLLPTTSQCKPSILVHLPQGIFYDPYTAEHARARSGKRAYEAQYLNGGRAVELEGAVGFSSRRKRRGQEEKGEQWWETNHSLERRTESARGEEEGVGVVGEHGGMQGLLEAVLREKVAEYTGERVVQGEQRVTHKIGAKAKPAKGSAANKVETQGHKDELSSLLIELNIDELRSQDGFTLNLPLHLRYHPPSNFVATTNTQLPSAQSPYLNLIHDIIPSSLSSLFHQTKHSLLSSGHESPPHPPKSTNTRDTAYVETSISQPTFFLNCHQSSSYIEGFYSTTFNDLFPGTHSHLIPTKQAKKNPSVLALSNRISTNKAKQLTVRVPVPNVGLLAPVQVITLITVISAALGTLYWLLARIVPLLEAVEASF
ncbi:uncharacterized protein UTRI_06517 [Ustilago trichophora]|uniref:Protein PBN1 n=1 Tax=Ustilago trichophora TaxID=86804 RepID=A0A5C3ENR2_9BASI|nr:uncharacterized protein UTRI_06517 [Ustilago trichophora]